MKHINAFAISLVFLASPIAWSAGTEATTSKTSSGPSISGSASDTQKSNTKGQILNSVMGASNLYQAKVCYGQCGMKGGGCCPLAPVYFLMGMQNLQQASAQGNTAGQAGSAFGMTDIGLGGSGYDPNALKNDPEARAGHEFIGTVTRGEAGFTYDKKTNSVTTSKGTTIKGSDLNSAAAMAAAGIPQSAIDALMSTERELLAKAEKKASKISATSGASSEEESSGGGGGDGANSTAGADPSGYGLGSGSGGLGIDRDPAQVAGMQKNYNGEPIGVAGDSIFSMMTRRYKAKESQSSFLDESELLIQK